MLKFIYSKTLQPIGRILHNRLIKPIFELEDSPHSISLGLAIGLWISLTPTVGVQMTVSLILCTIFRANVLIAIAMCWISNPITFIPMYYGYYRLGLVIMNEKPTPWEEFKQIIKNDYVIVTKEDPSKYKNQKFEEILKKIHTSKENFYFSKEHRASFEKLQKLSKKLNFAEVQNWGMNVSIEKSKTPLASIFEKVESKGGYGFIDRITYIKQKKIKEKKNLSLKVFVITSIKQEEPKSSIDKFLNLCWTLIAMGFKEFGIPMWVGSLIIATLLTIPAYPLTYRAITRFRKSKVSQKIREKTRRFASQRRKKKSQRLKKKQEQKDSENDSTQTDSEQKDIEA